MADIRTSVRNVFFHSVKAVNAAASSIATSTKVKVDEMNLKNRRREAMTEVSKCVHSLWQSGEKLPEELEVLMEEIAQIDEELIKMKEKPAKPEAEPANPEVEPADEESSGEEGDDVPVMEVADEADKGEEADETVYHTVAEEPSHSTYDPYVDVSYQMSDAAEPDVPVLDVKDEAPKADEDDAE